MVKHSKNHVLKLGYWTGVFSQFVFFVWLEFCFSVWCYDFERFAPCTFLGNMEISVHWVFLKIVFDGDSLVSVWSRLF